MPTNHESAMAPLNAPTMAAVIQECSQLWEWDSKYRDLILNKLTRGSNQIRPLSPAAAATIVDLCAEGWGLDHALRHCKVTQRQYFAWIAKSHWDEIDAQPYRDFRLRLREALKQNSARTGLGDADELRQLRQLGLA